MADALRINFGGFFDYGSVFCRKSLAVGSSGCSSRCDVRCLPPIYYFVVSYLNNIVVGENDQSGSAALGERSYSESQRRAGTPEKSVSPMDERTKNREATKILERAGEASRETPSSELPASVKEFWLSVPLKIH